MNKNVKIHLRRNGQYILKDITSDTWTDRPIEIDEIEFEESDTSGEM